MVALNYAPTLAAAPTPDTIALQREYAKHLLAGNDQPIHSWSQGLAGIVDALVGGTMARKAGEREAAGTQSANDAFIQMLTGQGAGASPAGNGMVPGAEVSQAPAPSSPEPDGGMFAGALDAIAPAASGPVGAAPAVSTPAAVGAPALDPAKRQAYIALLKNPFATPEMKAYVLKQLQPPAPPEYGFETVDGQLVRTNKATGGAEPIYTAPTKPSNDYGDYRKDKEEGYGGSFQDWQKERDARRRQVLSPEEQTNLAENEARVKAFVANAGENAKDMQPAEDLAHGIDRLEGLLNGVDTGTESAIKKWIADTTGLPVGGADKLQAISALTTFMAQKMRSPGSGPASDVDVAMFLNSLPSVIRQPGGNALIVDTMRSLAHQRIAKAQISEDYLAGTIDSKKALQLTRELPDPFANFKKAAPTAATPTPAPATSPPAAAGAGGPPPGSRLSPDEWKHLTPDEQAEVSAARQGAPAATASPAAPPVAPPGMMYPPTPQDLPLPPFQRPAPAPTGDPYLDSPMRVRR